MKVICNQKINENSVNAFIDIVAPEVSSDRVCIDITENSDAILIKIQHNGQSSQWKHKKYSAVSNQALIMIKGALYRHFKKHLAWGTLIGVRPTKLYRSYRSETESSAVREILRELYLVSEEKITLLETIYEKQYPLLKEKRINLYVGIPYCPTRCSYCSFASYKKEGKYLQGYEKFLECLIEEIKCVGKTLKEKNLTLSTIYIGGGTPAILSLSDLENLLCAIDKSLPKNLIEYSFEAGRTELLCEKTLEILKKYGVTRISLNPQTFKEETLKNVGRTFDKTQFDRIYQLAKPLFQINMDLIMGLPGESDADMLKTLETIKQYDIDNLTVHALAIKRSAAMYHMDLPDNCFEAECVNQAIIDTAKTMNLEAYYMYRQKNSIDGLENIGFSSKCGLSYFNVQMIEENDTTIGVGGGAISKFNQEDQIVRLINPKDPLVYCREFQERLEKKIAIIKEINHDNCH